MTVRNPDEPTEAVATVRYCATHPNVETELECGKCGRLICPRCLVQTPVGARCRGCAQLRRLPMFTLRPVDLVRMAVATVVLATAVGWLWALAFPRPGRLGFMLLLAGVLIGALFAKVVDWAGRGKRGPAVTAIAALGVLLAYLVHNLLLYGVLVTPLLLTDIWSLILVGIGAVTAWYQLR
jgi:hypothetical protein